MAAISYDRGLAMKAADENYSLQKRLARVEKEEEAQRREAEYESRLEETINTGTNDRMQQRNKALEAEITDLEKQLRELQMNNVTELQHIYVRLGNRRSYLLNEIAGLRRILANQSHDVKRAIRKINGQHELRCQNNEQHASLLEDIQMFKNKKESLAKETQRLIAKEGHLLSEIETLPAPGEDLETTISRLRMKNEKKDRIIARLETAVEEERRMKNAVLVEEKLSGDLQHLREEYVYLNDQLKRSKQEIEVDQ